MTDQAHFGASIVANSIVIISISSSQRSCGDVLPTAFDRNPVLFLQAEKQKKETDSAVVLTALSHYSKLLFKDEDLKQVLRDEQIRCGQTRFQGKLRRLARTVY